jgi:Exostosin family
MAVKGRPALHSYAFHRFQVFDAGPDYYACRDWLQRGERLVPKQALAGMDESAQAAALFRQGFVRHRETALPTPVRQRPADPAGLLFWQFPCRTEAAAFDVHAAPPEPDASTGDVHCYVGLPWATWIDKQRADPEQLAAHQQVRLLVVRLSGLRHMLQSLGLQFRVHTVCQHIYWPRMLGHWRRIGITDLWLSHAAPGEAPAEAAGLRIHPWHLYAVNVLDPERRQGLQIGKDPATKRHLASFIGTHMPHYLSDARLRLRALAGQPGFAVQVTQDKWHFEDVVYRHQVHHEPLAGSYAVDESVSRYNSLLSDSVFSLCPVGAGPNTLRLWESLAVGSVPVLLGPPPRMPQGGSLPPIDWDSIVLRIADEQIADLPQILRRMPMDEVRRRQQLGLQAFAQVQAQRCF